MLSKHRTEDSGEDAAPPKGENEGSSLLTSVELCKRLNFKRARLSRMKASGCPVAGTRTLESGGRTQLWDWNEVREWMAINVKTKSVQDAAGESASMASEDGVAKTKAEKEPSREGTWANALQRTRYMEQIEFNEYVKSVREGNMLIAAHASKRWRENLDSLRKMEVDAAKIERQRGEVMPVTDHERIFLEAHGLAANELRGLSKKIAPILVGMTDIHDIVSVLEKEVRTCMRHINTKMETIGD